MLMALEAIGYVVLTLLLETKATRALARQLDKLRVAPFLLRLSRQSTGNNPFLFCSLFFFWMYLRHLLAS